MTRFSSKQSWWPVFAAILIPALLVIFALFFAPEVEAPSSDEQVAVVVRVVDASGAPLEGKAVRMLPGAGEETIVNTTDSAGYATASFRRRGSLAVSVEGGPTEPHFQDLGQSRKATIEITIPLAPSP